VYSLTRKFYVTVWMSVLFVSWLMAQSVDTTSVESKSGNWAKNMVKKYYSFSGNFGAYGEVFHTTARYKRRPASTARSSLNMTFGFWKIQMPVEMVLSTEEVTFRQSFNRLGLNPRIGFVTFHVGDFAGKISQFTVSGISIRGGGIEVDPKWVHFIALYGRTQRAVNDPRAMTYAYKRMLMAAKLGFGLRNKSFLEINFVKAADDKNSLDIPVDSSKVFPQENLALGLNGQIALFQNRLRFRGEGAASVHTLNTFGEKYRPEGMPAWIDKYYSIRITSRIDYAYRGDLTVNTNRVRARAGYQYIGPGYISLGLPYSLNDREKYNGYLNAQIVPRRVSFRGNFNYSHDNLNNQKVKTLKHLNYMAGLMLKPVQSLMLNFTYSKNKLVNETNLDSLIYWENNVEKKRLLFDTYNGRYMINAAYSFKTLGVGHNIRAAYSLQKSERQNEASKENNFDAQMINGGYSVLFSPKLNMGLNFTNTTNKLIHRKIQTQTYGFSMSYTPFMRWRNNFAINMQVHDKQKSVNYTLRSQFRVTLRSSLNLNLLKIDFFDPVNKDREYKEYTGTLTYNYSF